MKPVIIHNEAKQELDSAIAYYEVRQVGLGLDFLSDVEQAISRIQQNPNVGEKYKITGFRRYVMQRFPYLVFYVEFEDFIWVVAIAHGKRKPNYWKKRQVE